MPDKIISVRMPASLVEELKDLVDKNHYLDVSEQIRSILRSKWLEYRDPYSSSLNDIKSRMGEMQMPGKVKALKGELKRLLEDLDDIE